MARSREWLRSRQVRAGVAGLLIVALAGFGLGFLTRPGDSGPDLSEEEAYSQAREQTMKEVSREMARQGFEDGKRSGRNHGIVAGGMAAESSASIVVLGQRAAAAQSKASAAQSQLAGMTAAPSVPSAPPTDTGTDDN